MLALATRLHHTVGLLLRQCRGIVDEVGASRRLAGLMHDAAATLHSLAAAVGNWHRPDHARTQAAELAGRCGPDEFAEEGWRAFAVVSIMRSVAIDVLQLSGLSRGEARQLLPDTGADDPEEEHRTALPEDAASELWGCGDAHP